MIAEKNVLIVEDNPDDEALMVRGLRRGRLANEITVVRDGAEALDYIFGEGQYAGRDVSDQPQVILLDLMLPKIGGLDVLRRIRADPRTETLPVVILTSSDEQRDIVEGYELKVNSYVRKPVDFQAFASAVEQLGLYWLVLNVSAEPVKQPHEAAVLI